MSNKHRDPQYPSQRMIGADATKPAVTPWLYGLKVLGSRFVALTLTVVDGIVSGVGMYAGGASLLAAITGAVFIAMFQMAIALALTSGQPIGARFQARFFEDEGIVGFIKRVFGGLLLILGGSLYVWDIATNYLAFSGGQVIPSGEDGSPLPGAWLLVLGFLVMAIALSLGDELLHVLADENALGERVNSVRFTGQRYDADLLHRYQQHYMKSARPVADETGANHGSQWRPRDLS